MEVGQTYGGSRTTTLSGQVEDAASEEVLLNRDNRPLTVEA
jgi:hypothetical protein